MARRKPWRKRREEMENKILKQTFDSGYQYGFQDDVKYLQKTKKGLSEDVVRRISKIKNEPKWMLEKRLEALRLFHAKPMPAWGADLSKIDFDNIVYYASASDKPQRSWDDVPEKMKQTFEKLGIPEAERKFLAGAGAQYDSEVAYHHLREDLEKKGVVFLDMDSGLKEHEDLVRKYFGSIIPSNDNKFAALNTAVWSGGSFLYVPKGVHVDVPLQAYFRINTKNMGQFERTMIIAEPGSSIHYLEGCSAPQYTSDSLHSAVVEILAMEGARVQYTTIQNWSGDVYNLVTKRAKAFKDATVFWLDGNLGCLTGDSKVFTDNDVKEIKNVEVGEYVYSIGPEFGITRQKVLARKENPKRPVFRIKTENQRELKATDNHPFLVLNKKGKLVSLRWTPLADIKPGDYVGVSGVLPDLGQPFRIPPLNQKRAQKKIRVPAESTDELMWLLGFYVGDGYLEEGRVGLACPPSDRAHEKVKQLVRKLFGLESSQAGVVIRINSTSLVRFIRMMDFKGNARTKRLPPWVFRLPHSQKKALIDGYIAADGYMRKNHKNISITSVNRPLLEDVKTLALSCGMNPSKISHWIRREKKPLGKEEKIYEHYFLYFTERIPETPLHFSKVSEIVPVGSEITYDIEVEGPHNFIANGIFVHNSKITMKYPSVLLMEPGARGEVVSVALAGKGQHQDAGAKIFHLAPNTSSLITSKSISKDGGRTTYRGLLYVAPNASNVKSNVECDALILDEESASDTVPYMQIQNDDVSISHEATVSKIDSEKLFYLQSRGFSEQKAKQMLVQGFIEPFVKKLPMEYAVELNRLVEMEMEGSVG